MSTGTRPPLLQFGGQESFWRYRREFQRLYQSKDVTIVDVLGRRVLFPENSCRHVCFKGDAEDRYSRSSRANWSQERADRIGWILPALTDARIEVRPEKDLYNRINYLLVVEADPIKGLEQEYYCVVAEKLEANAVVFVTAFPINHRNWANRRLKKALYPQKKKDKA